MAKDRKHNQQGDDNGMENGTSHDTVYRLSTGRWANVKSKIQSLNLDTVEKGKFAVDKKVLLDDKGGYRFIKRVSVPMLCSEKLIKVGPPVTRDELVAEFTDFLDAVTAYDAATQIQSPDGSRSVDRKYTICEGYKSPVDYVRHLIFDAHKLAIQKNLQPGLRAEAEITVMADMGLTPIPKTERVTVDEDSTPADENAAFGDTL
jgi:hypothetical protein